jgi:putative ABC transport system permease protein
MRPRWKKVIADLWGNLTRSTLVVASITVGLLAIGIIATIHYVITEDMRAGYQKINPANLFINAGLYDKGYLDHLARVPGVRQAEGSREASLRLESNPGEWIGLHLKSMPDLNQMAVNQVHLEQGVWPPADHQIVMESSKLYKAHASLGDFVTIETPSGKTRRGIRSERRRGELGHRRFFHRALAGLRHPKNPGMAGNSPALSSEYGLRHGYRRQQ